PPARGRLPRDGHGARGSRAVPAPRPGVVRPGARRGGRLQPTDRPGRRHGHGWTGWTGEDEAMSDAPAIAIEGVVKTFGSTRALDGLDLQVEPGEVHGFLGPNGAGKSTAI